MISLQEGMQLSDGGVVSFVGAGGKTSLMFRLAHELAAAGVPVLTTTTTKICIPTKAQSGNVFISAALPEVLDQARQYQIKNFHFTAALGKISSQNKLKGYPPWFIDDLWKSRLFRWILVEADGAAGRALKAPAAHEPVVPSCTRWVIGVAGLDGVERTLDERSVFRAHLFAELTGLALGQTVSVAAIAACLAHPEGIFRGSPGDARRYLFLNKAECAGGIQAGREIVKIIKAAADRRISRVLIGNALKSPPVAEIYDI